jgi:hypothetical protein
VGQDLSEEEMQIDGTDFYLVEEGSIISIAKKAL